MNSINKISILLLCSGTLSYLASRPASAQQPPAIPAYTSPAFDLYQVPKGDWGLVSDGLQLRATTVNSEYRITDPIVVDIDARYSNSTNLLSETVATEREFNVTVTDSQGHAVPKTRYGNTISPLVDGRWGFRNRPLILDSGQMAEWHFWLNHIYDMSLPGIYLVDISRAFPKNDGTIGKAETLTLQIKVTNEEPRYGDDNLQSARIVSAS
jgi:hypothetical protein